MKLHQLTSTKSKTKTRVGRGIAAGQGKTAGRGTKGQKSRSGYNLPRRFEGGQTALLQRLPKMRGMKSHAYRPETLSYAQLEQQFNDGETITKETLWTHQLIKRADRPVKIVGSRERKKSFQFADDILLTNKLKSELVKNREAVSKNQDKK